MQKAGITDYKPIQGDDSEFDFVFTYVGHRVGTMNNSAWQKARVRAAMHVYEESGKTIPNELLIEGQRGTRITDERRARNLSATFFHERMLDDKKIYTHHIG